MPLEKFRGMIKQAGIISKMECGGDETKQETSLTGEQGVALAQRMFPRRK